MLLDPYRPVRLYIILYRGRDRDASPTILTTSCQRQDAPKSWTKIIPSPLLRYPIPSPIQRALFSIQAGHCFPFIEQTRMKIYRRGV